MSFCRTNLFKRLESSGFSFLISLARHVLRNTVFFICLFKMACLFPLESRERADIDEFLEEDEQWNGEVSLSFITDRRQYWQLAKEDISTLPEG